MPHDYSEIERQLEERHGEPEIPLRFVLRGTSRILQTRFMGEWVDVPFVEDE